MKLIKINNGYLLPTAEEAAIKRDFDYSNDYDLNSLTMEPMTPLRDTEYLSDTQSDSEYSSSSNSQYYIFMFPLVLLSWLNLLFLKNLIIWNRKSLMCIGGMFGLSSIGSPESGSGESDPEFSYPLISSE